MAAEREERSRAIGQQLEAQDLVAPAELHEADRRIGWSRAAIADHVHPQQSVTRIALEGKARRLRLLRENVLSSRIELTSTRRPSA